MTYQLVQFSSDIGPQLAGLSQNFKNLPIKSGIIRTKYQHLKRFQYHYIMVLLHVFLRMIYFVAQKFIFDPVCWFICGNRLLLLSVSLTRCELQSYQGLSLGRIVTLFEGIYCLDSSINVLVNRSIVGKSIQQFIKFHKVCSVTSLL